MDGWKEWNGWKEWKEAGGQILDVNKRKEGKMEWTKDRTDHGMEEMDPAEQNEWTSGRDRRQTVGGMGGAAQETPSKVEVPPKSTPGAQSPETTARRTSE